MAAELAHPRTDFETPRHGAITLWSRLGTLIVWSFMASFIYANLRSAHVFDFDTEVKRAFSNEFDLAADVSFATPSVE